MWKILFFTRGICVRAHLIQTRYAQKMCAEMRNIMNQILQEDLNIINVGLKGFEQDMEKQGAAVCQVDWKPVAGGNRKILDALDRIESLRDKIEKANAEVVARIRAA